MVHQGQPKNAAIVHEVVAEVTGRRLAVEFTVGTGGAPEAGEDEPASEDEFVSLFKSTFDAREVDEPER